VTLDRRLAKVDEQLLPLELVLRWLNEAHAAAGFSAYLDGLLELPLDETPLNLLFTSAERSMKARFNGRDSPESRRALRVAIQQVVLRFELVMRANVLVGEQYERAGLLQALFASQLAMLGYSAKADGIDDAWRLSFATVRDNAFHCVDGLLATKAARATVERRYFAGQSILFPDLVAAEAITIAEAQRLAVIADALRERDGVAPFVMPAQTSSRGLKRVTWPISWSGPGPRPSTSSARARGRMPLLGPGCGGCPQRDQSSGRPPIRPPGR